MIAPASAVPVKVSVLSLVMPSPAAPVSSVQPVITGVAGAEVSTVTPSAPLSTPLLPAASVACAVKLCAPSPNAAVVKLHVPAPVAVTVPSDTPPSKTSIAAPASAVPLRVSVLPAVMPSPPTPVSEAKPVMTGAAGAAVSTVTTRAGEAALTLPAASVAVALKLCAPSARAAVAKLQAPAPFAVTVPSDVAPSKISICAPASAVPVSTSVVSDVMPSPPAPVSSE